MEERKLTFEMEASDEADVIGRGIHDRRVIDAARKREAGLSS
ncbi:MAG: thioesterase, FlK family [Rubrobacteraceae bacterium]